MKDVITSSDVTPIGAENDPPCTGLTSDAIPEVQMPVLAWNSDTGVSTSSVRHWYALRATYGRERKAHDYIISKGTKAFYPTITSVRVINGQRTNIEESRIPNLFFAYGTEDEIKSYVYDNVHLPYLRFYYKHTSISKNLKKEPMIVPDYQIESLRCICEAEAADIILSSDAVDKFRAGEMVQVIAGDFEGVIGIVARYQGQQRVGIVIDGLLTAATAYIPSAFLSKL